MTKEETYDTEIGPLMAKIIEICKREKIAMLASFELDEDPENTFCCTTVIAPAGFVKPEHQQAVRLISPRRSVMAFAETTTMRPDGSTRITTKRME